MKASKSKATWNLAPLYKGDNDPKIKSDMLAVKKANYQFINKWQDRTDYLEKSSVLKEAFDEYEALQATNSLTGKYGYYFWLRSSQEESNPKLKGICQKITDEATKIENDLQFFEIKIAKIEKANQAKFLNSPDLKIYHHYLKRAFDNAKYILSEPEEKIMNLKVGPAHSRWVDMTSSLLAKQTRTVLLENGKRAEKPLAEISSLASSQTKRVRDTAFKAVLEVNNHYAEIAEAELNAIFNNKQINDELRGFTRPETSRHLSDDIDTEIVDALAQAVSEHFKIAHRYYKLKAQLFKKTKLDYHERNVSYGVLKEAYLWPKATKLVGETLQKLDHTFGEIFTNFVTKGQIDIYPKAGKSSGAFCAHNLKNQPTYILLNYTNRLEDVLTLAHEVGHGINNELMRIQPAVYFGTPVSTAEVASTFMEDFILQELLRDCDEQTRLNLMMKKLNDDISTIFRQIAGYRFEQELHQTVREKGYVAKEEIGKIFEKHMKSYMGPSVAHTKGTENLWVHWSHFRSFFYVYSYASGLLISKALQAKVKADPQFINQVKEFLATGTSESPAIIFQKLGLNISDKKFWLTGLNEVALLLKETEKMAKKLDKI